MIKIREILLCEGSIRLPKRYYYRLWGYAHQLWLRQDGDALILSPDYGDSIAMIKKLPTGIFLYIQPDLLEDIAAFNGDLLRIELLEPAYAAPELRISVEIGEITPELLAGAAQMLNKK